jgi:D-psicose/D-tagatose/L-ribulose 3-epimerase
MAFRIGVNTWVWTSPLHDEALRALAPKIAGWGFDTIELPVENLGDWAPGAAKALLDDLGLTATVVLAMAPGRELVRADPGTVASTQDYLRSCVDVAFQVGSPVIAGPAYTSVGRTWRATYEEREFDIRELRDNLLPVLEHARQAGVTVAVEPLNRYETSLLNTIGQTLEALAGLPSCGIALDFYHQNIEETNITAAIRAANGRIAHVQVCANDRGTPGRDHLDWRALLDALTDARYHGPLCIESFTSNNASIATAASIWRPLAASQDDLATDGLAFLKSLA